MFTQFWQTLTFIKVLKIFGIFLLGIIIISAAIGLMGTALSSLFGGSSSYQRGYSESPYPMSKSMFDGDRVSENVSGGAYINSDVAPGVPQAEREMEIRSNRVRIFSKSPENECQALLTDVRKEFTRVLSTNITQDYCSLQIQVLRDKTAELDTILKKYDIDRIDTDTENIYKSYTETSDRVIELEKSLTENEARIAETKTAYDALLAQSGNRTLNAETIDAISKAIRNKAELIDSFSDKKRNLIAQIDALKKQKADYEDAVKYVTYQLNVEKRVIIDSEAIGERWYADIRELSNTFQETLRNVTVNLLSFLLRAFGVVIYIVIGGILVLGGGRIGWKMARRILGIQEKEVNSKS